MPKAAEKTITTVGKRKKAIARAVLKKGSGRIRINSKPINQITPRYINMRLREPLTLGESAAKSVDINVSVKGGGVWGQADAARTAISKALVRFEPSLKQTFLDYDRSMLISDSRQTEPHKPSRSTAGPRRTKQQSKR